MEGRGGERGRGRGGREEEKGGEREGEERRKGEVRRKGGRERGGRGEEKGGGEEGASYARNFSQGRWSFLGPGSEKKWYSTHESKPQGERDKVAELMMIKFSESGHPFFLFHGKLSIYFCADERND